MKNEIKTCFLETKPNADQYDEKLNEIVATTGLDLYEVDNFLSNIEQEIEDDYIEQCREEDNRPKGGDPYAEHRFGHFEYGLTR